MRILVTNDDGIHSEGLHVLARSLLRLGEVVVVAPDQEYSGSSASLGALSNMEPAVTRHDDLGDGYAAWSVAGPPALCVVFARLGVFGPRFDLIVSGINPGANVGRAIYHSGTVGAATTGRIARISAIAVSQDVDMGSIEGQALPGVLVNQQWQTAADLAAVAAEQLIAGGLPEEAVLLNLNVPNLPIEEIRGWRRTSIGMLPVRAIKAATLEPVEGAPGMYRSVVSWGDVIEQPPDTDSGAVEHGYVSVTWLSPMRPEEPPASASVEARFSEMVPAAPVG